MEMSKTEKALDECVICIEKLDKDEDFISTLPCGHSFHSPCIIEYFYIHKKPECPLCRNMVFNIPTLNKENADNVVIHVPQNTYDTQNVQAHTILNSEDYTLMDTNNNENETSNKCHPFCISIGVSLVLYWSLSYIVYKFF